jgi:hypothetical protein
MLTVLVYEGGRESNFGVLSCFIATYSCSDFVRYSPPPIFTRDIAEILRCHKVQSDIIERLIRINISLRTYFFLVIVHNFGRLRNNLFITLIPLHVSTLLGHLQVFPVIFNYISILLTASVV